MLTFGIIVQCILPANSIKTKAVDNINLPFGVISDIHLKDTPDETREDINLKKALQNFKNNNIKVLMVAGDIADLGETNAYNKFNRIFNEVFPVSVDAPKKVLVMGNHDYNYNYAQSVSAAQTNFTNTLGVSLNTNITVDGHHFIGLSTEAGDVGGLFTDTSKTWLRQQLEAANAEDSSKPIFICVHQPVRNTVYLSDAWGTDALNDVLKDYPQVVLFAGHSHAVLEDERSIYQKDYTCVGTSTLSYAELETGKANGSVPSRANEVAQGLVGKVSNTAVTLERRDFHNDCKIKNDWTIPLPINKTNFTYTDARANVSVAPYFQSGSTVTASNITGYSCTAAFSQAKHSDIVQSYRIKVTNSSTGTVAKDFLIFSDFYLGLSRMSPTMSYPITGLSPSTNYEVSVYAIESFGKQSEPISTSFSTPQDTVTADILNVNFTDSTGKDSSSNNTSYQLKQNAKVALDSSLHKKVLVLDGSSYANYSTSAEQISRIKSQFTFEAVFKMNSIKSQVIAENCEGSGIGFESDSTGKVELWVMIGSSYKRIGVQLSAGTYYHLLATYDGSAIKLYLNGTLVNTMTGISGNVIYPSGIPMCIGGDPSTTGTANLLLDGNVGLLRIMNKAISASEVTNHYNQYMSDTGIPTKPDENDNLYLTGAGFQNAAAYANGVTYTNSNGVVASSGKTAENSCVLNTAIIGLTQMMDPTYNNRVKIDTLKFVAKTKLTITDMDSTSWYGAGLILRYDAATQKRLMLRYSRDGNLRITGLNGGGIDYLATFSVPQSLVMNLTVVQTKSTIDAYIGSTLYLSYTIPDTTIYYAMPYAFGLYSVYSTSNLSETSLYFAERVDIPSSPKIPATNSSLYNPYAGFDNTSLYYNYLPYTHSGGILASTGKDKMDGTVISTAISGKNTVYNPADNSEINIDSLTFVTKTKLTITDIGSETWHGACVLLRYDPVTKRHMMLRYLKDGYLRITGFYGVTADYLASTTITPSNSFDFIIKQTKDAVYVSVNGTLVLTYYLPSNSSYLSTPYAFGLCSTFCTCQLSNTSLYFAQEAGLTLSLPQNNYNLYSGTADISVDRFYNYNTIVYTNENNVLESTDANGENACVVTTALTGQSKMLNSGSKSITATNSLTLIEKTNLTIESVGSTSWYGAGVVLRYEPTTERHLALRYSIDGKLRLFGRIFDQVDYLQTADCQPGLSQISFTVVQKSGSIKVFMDGALYIDYTFPANSSYIKCPYAFGLQSVYSISKLTETSLYFAENVHFLQPQMDSSLKIKNNYIRGFAVGNTVSMVKASVSGNQISGVSVLKNGIEASDNEVISTGMKVRITDTKNHTYEYTAVVYGDVTGEGGVSPLDLIKMRNVLIGKSTLSGEYFEAGDLYSRKENNILCLLGIKEQVLSGTSINQTPTTAESNYNFDNYMKPYWEGSTVYNESAMALTNQDGSIDAIALMYHADKVLSVRNSELNQEYIEGVDWELTDGKIRILPGSSIAITDYADFYFSAPITNHSFACTKGGYIFYNEGSTFHKKQFVVTYTHSDSWSGPKPVSKSTNLPKTVEKLKNNQPVNVLFYGDSITVGYNSSGLIGESPYLPNWTNLFVTSLQKKYNNTNITSVNTAVGGMTAAWGANNAQALAADKHPDLAVIAFGMNDGGNYSLEQFKANIQTIMNTVKATNPDCEFILVAPMVPNKEVAINLANVPYYYTPLSELETTGVVMANVTETHQYLLTKKRFFDMTGNNINHTNDFLVRLYAQTLSTVL